MTLITAQQLTRITKGKPPSINVAGFADAINTYGPDIGLDQPHRLAQFVPQTMHETTGLIDMKERWGPTPAQKRYEGRKDLGNTQKGDGSKYRGYGMIQLTGRDNVTRFYKWCVAQGYDVPNFIDHPEEIAKHPWAGLAAIWYWHVGNPTGKSLNVYADKGDIENITRKINGGLNGYDDRLSYYDRTSLVLLGYGVNELKKFQTDEALTVDGISGPNTRASFQKELLKLTSKSDQSAQVAKAPVVQKTTKTVIETEQVVPASVEKQVKKKFNLMGAVVAFFASGGSGLSGLMGADWTTVATIVGGGVVVVALILWQRQNLLTAFKEIRDGLSS